MEIAVLADIHSNYVALDTCMEYARDRGITKFIFLGDYVGELSYPERTMERIYRYREAYDCVFIRGNKEDYWPRYRDGGEKGWKEYNSTTGAMYYAYHHLTKEDIRFFESLPCLRRLRYDSLPELIACHGSTEGGRDAMPMGSARAREVLEQADADYILCGHTHIQGKTVHVGRTALNPGAVGVPLKADGKTQFAILHGENDAWREEFISLDYDRERVVRELDESGLAARAYHWCKITKLLLENKLPEKIGHARLLERTMELCRQGEGVCHWPDIPDQYWDMALAEIGL